MKMASQFGNKGFPDVGSLMTQPVDQQQHILMFTTGFAQQKAAVKYRLRQQLFLLPGRLGH